MHFHPGWGFAGGTVLEAISASGRYRSQWETGTSNGGLTARPGGDRWRWESRIFGGRYDDAVDEERPVYGAWNRRQDPYGAAPRFGSAYLRLRPAVSARAIFCWPDSVYDPRVVGGVERLDDLCRLADAGALDPGLLPDPAADLPLDDPLNDYVEAHVHEGLGRGTPSTPSTAAPCRCGWRVGSAVTSRRRGWPRRRGPASTIRRRSSGCGTASPGSAGRRRRPDRGGARRVSSGMSGALARPPGVPVSRCRRPRPRAPRGLRCRSWPARGRPGT